MFLISIGHACLSLSLSGATFYGELNTTYEAVLPCSGSYSALLQTRKGANVQVDGINAVGQFTRLGRLEEGQKLIGHITFDGSLMPVASQAQTVLLTKDKNAPMASTSFNLLYTNDRASIGVLHSSRLAFWIKEPYTNESVLVDRSGTDYSIGLDRSGSEAALVQCTATAKGSLLDAQVFRAKDGKVQSSRRTWPLKGQLGGSSALDGDLLFTTVVNEGVTRVHCYRISTGQMLGVMPLNIRIGRDALVSSEGTLWFITPGSERVGSVTWPGATGRN